MRLKRIRLRRVPGIDPEFTLEKLGDGINVVVGANGSGKTSVCKALTATLWPGRDGSRKLEVETLWQDGERFLSAERDGVRVRWQRDGVPAEPPELPAESLSACYTMGVRDLLVGGDDTDGDIARKIRVQMSGGYDLGKIICEQFTMAAQLGRRERGERDQAERRLRAVQQKFRDLASEEDRLEELLSAERRSQLAQAEVGRLERAADLAKAKQALASSRDEFESFPEGMAALRSEDLDALAELERKRDRAAAEAAANREKLEQAEDAIEASGLAQARPDETELEVCFDHLSRAETLARDIVAAREQLAMACAKLEHARKTLGASSGTAPPANLSPEVLDSAESLLTRVNKLRDKYAGVEAQIGLLTDSDDEEETDDPVALSRASDSLRNWLASPAPASRAVPVWQLVAAASVTVVAAGLAVYHDLAWLFLAGVGATMAVSGLVLRLRGARGDDDLRHRWAREFERSGVAVLGEWRPDAVRALLHRLDERCVRAKAGEHRRSQLRVLRQRLRGFDSEQAELDAARLALRDEMGLDVDCRIDSDLTLSVLARRWRDCDGAAVVVAETEARVETLVTECSKIRTGLAGFLTEHGRSCSDDLSEIRARLGDLQRRLHDYERSSEQRDLAARQLDRESAEEKDALARIEGFYADRGLGIGDRPALEDRLRRLGHYLDTASRLEHQAQLVRDGEARLADHAELLGLSHEDANARLEQARREAEGLAKISAEIGSIRGRIAEAGSQAELESAQADLTEADDRLREVGEQARATAAGRFLLDEVDREHERESRPAVLARAMEYFAAFTHNAYELMLPDDEGAQFRARDTSSGRGLAISQLSEGTRIQLLLAVRVAFAISAERGCRLPLVFDEVLSTADPQRFNAVAESLCVLAGEGRQVFYMTSNPADAARWQRVCYATDETDLRVIDLGEVRGEQAAVRDAAEIEIAALPEVPSPNGRTPEDYAVALGVPSVDPFASFTQLHLFYVLRDDLDTLYRLMRQFRLSTVGEWCSLANSGRAERLLGARLCARVDALCVCAAAVHEAWQVGRGRPISRGVLEESGAVSDTYIDRIVDLSRDLGGDGKRLVAAMSERSDERVRGFRVGSLDALKEYLEEQGYIDHSPVLDLSSIYSRSLDAAHEAVKAEVVEESECATLVTGLLAMLERHAAPDVDGSQPGSKSG